MTAAALSALEGLVATRDGSVVEAAAWWLAEGLSPAERALVLAAAARSLAVPDAVAVLEAAWGLEAVPRAFGVGDWPGAVWPGDEMAAAEHWAEGQPEDVLAAFAAATVARLPRPRRAEFVRWAARQVLGGGDGAAA